MMGDETKPVTWYIVGAENALECTSTPPRMIFDSQRGGWQMRWPIVTGGYQMFRVVRGRAEEFRTYDDGQRVYARELPEDARPDLLAHNAEVIAAEAALEAARGNRRAFLEAQVLRGKLASAWKATDEPA